jgi:hypothetical protein
MTYDSPGSMPVPEDRVSAMATRITAILKECPQSLLADLEPGSLRQFYQKMAMAVPADAPREKVFCTALKVSSWYPDLFAKSYPSIKELNSTQLLEFSQLGSLPRKRRGPTK